MMDDCWLKSIALFDPPIEQVSIPYEGTALRGFYFRGKSAKEKRPLLILNNGSDGSALDMWMLGAAGATARGYDCLTFDGPGQGYALLKQGLHFRPDWERVITPVIDFALSRPGVDPKRIAIQGISQGGYWVPRAVAFEKRIAAAIADPGVVDVSTSWTATLPPPMLQLLKGGRKSEFDELHGQDAGSCHQEFLGLPHATLWHDIVLRRLQSDDGLQPHGRHRQDRVSDADHGARQRGVLAGAVAPLAPIS